MQLRRSSCLTRRQPHIIRFIHAALVRSRPEGLEWTVLEQRARVYAGNSFSRASRQVALFGEQRSRARSVPGSLPALPR